ncbi:hypothetical protein D9M72_529660 [compost metagenome]|uniref:Arm DNA-binding domain-containing protein n=1 Tax=Variovorax boronicumulans TaxID=436515 RepID=UPI0034458B8F
MQFDARAAKLLKPGEHIMVDGCPGLCLVASATKRTWIYRFKLPLNGRMRQKAIGQWPALSLVAAAVEWEAISSHCAAGGDPAIERCQAAAAPSASLPRNRATRCASSAMTS